MNPTPQEVKAARSNAGLSQAKAAKLCHVTLQGYQHWEYGVRKMHPAIWELFQIKIARSY